MAYVDLLEATNASLGDGRRSGSEASVPVMKASEDRERNPQDSIGCSQLWPLDAPLESRERVSEGEVLQK